MNTNRMMSTTKHLPNTFWGSAAAAVAAFALAATPATATPVQTPVSSADELAYAADVSNTDLLTGLTATTTGTWKPDSGASVTRLNDGVHGGSFFAVENQVQAAFGVVGSTATYNLGAGANNLGYDITSIQSIAAWVNVGFGNQAYTVDVKLKGETSYTTLATVDCELRPTDGGATKVTLTDGAGVLASGVEFIRFTLNPVNAGANDGAFMPREFDVFGVSTGGDTTPPTIVTVNPTDNASGVTGTTALVATFDENILSGIGNITIKNLSTSTETVIPVGTPQVSVASAVLTIHPSTSLAPNTNYAIWIDNTAIKDLANNPFAGIADDTTWNFTTSSQVQTKVFSATELDYAGNVSSTDLLTGLTATLNGNSTWNIDGNHGGANPVQLNDGVHGGSFFNVGNTCQGAQPNPGATAEYNLGLGANNLGYDLTSIQSIAAWVNGGFGNQAFTVEVKLIGAPDYTPLATVDYQPLALNGIGATKVTLTDLGGVLATGVEFIRFTANRVNGGQNDGDFMWREIDVIGVSTGGDMTSPTIVTRNPTVNASGVVGTTALVATFDESILSGTGNITIKNLSTSTETVIPLGDPQVSVAGPVLTIHPTAELTALTNYAIWIDTGAIKDLANNPFAGIADDTTWNFTTSSLVQTKVFSTTELAYAGEVSNSDLLTGLTATLNGNSNWNIDGNHGGANPAQLNDGVHGGSFFDVGNTCQGAQPNPGATATYHLGLGANNLGYDLTSIQSIAAWVNAGFGNQAFTVEVKLIAATDYTPLAAVNYQPLALNGVGATKVTLTDVGVGGVLATGVEFIRFTANSANGGQNGGDFMWREIDVIGAPTGGASSSYGSWASTHGLTGTAGDGSGTDPAFDADPNKEGVANGLVWLIGGTTGDPLANNSSILPVPTADGGKLVLSFQCLKSGARGTANLTVQYSNDLGAGWQGVPVPDSDQADGGSGVGFVVAPITGSDYNNVTATIAAPVPGGRLFGRLMATE